jgi:hypothetical protein
MNSKGAVFVWVIISTLLLIAAIYFFYHNLQPGLRDTDGNNPYKKGEIYKREFIGWSLISIDKCEGNEMPEQIVEKDKENDNLYHLSYEITYCENGCQNGACIN